MSEENQKTLAGLKTLLNSRGLSQSTVNEAKRILSEHNKKQAVNLNVWCSQGELVLVLATRGYINTKTKSSHDIYKQLIHVFIEYGAKIDGEDAFEESCSSLLEEAQEQTFLSQLQALSEKNKVTPHLSEQPLLTLSAGPQLHEIPATPQSTSSISSDSSCHSRRVDEHRIEDSSAQTGVQSGVTRAEVKQFFLDQIKLKYFTPYQHEHADVNERRIMQLLGLIYMGCSLEDCALYEAVNFITSEKKTGQPLVFNDISPSQEFPLVTTIGFFLILKEKYVKPKHDDYYALISLLIQEGADIYHARGELPYIKPVMMASAVEVAKQNPVLLNFLESKYKNQPVNRAPVTNNLPSIPLQADDVHSDWSPGSEAVAHSDVVSDTDMTDTKAELIEIFSSPSMPSVGGADVAVEPCCDASARLPQVEQDLARSKEIYNRVQEQLKSSEQKNRQLKEQLASLQQKQAEWKESAVQLTSDRAANAAVLQQRSSELENEYQIRNGKLDTREKILEQREAQLTRDRAANNAALQQHRTELENEYQQRRAELEKRYQVKLQLALPNGGGQDNRVKYSNFYNVDLNLAPFNFPIPYNSPMNTIFASQAPVSSPILAAQDPCLSSPRFNLSLLHGFHQRSARVPFTAEGEASRRVARCASGKHKLEDANDEGKATKRLYRNCHVNSY